MDKTSKNAFNACVRFGCNLLSPEEGIDVPCRRKNGATHVPIESGTRVVSTLLK